MNIDKEKNHILLVDDDLELCHLLGEYLAQAGFTIAMAHSGEAALAYIAERAELSVVVLDIMMPGMSGLDVLQQLRRQSEVPVIMLTGRGDDIDRIVGLELGADDYLGKPCNPRELVARIHALMRRCKPAPSHALSSQPSVWGLLLNPATLEVSVDGNVLTLTGAEFRVLQLLVEHAGEILSKAYLTQEVLQRPLTAYDRSIDVHISRVRQKLAKQAGLPPIIKSVRGMGYQLVVESP